MTPTETIKQPYDLREKYLRINQDFPTLAGKFMQLSRAQRRLIEKQRGKMTDDQKELLVGHAELIEVGDELVKWTYEILKGVAEDSKALTEGARMREELKFAQELVTEYIK
jgi:recombinational DNA repair ATPase RecF